jgi:hypothetical protein
MNRRPGPPNTTRVVASAVVIQAGLLTVAGQFLRGGGFLRPHRLKTAW